MTDLTLGQIHAAYRAALEPHGVEITRLDPAVCAGAYLAECRAGNRRYGLSAYPPTANTVHFKAWEAVKALRDGRWPYAY